MKSSGIRVPACPAFGILVGKLLGKQAPECPRREQSSIERDPIRRMGGRWNWLGIVFSGEL